MKSRYVAFVIRIRFDEPGHGLPGSYGVHGTLQQAGYTQTLSFDTFDRLVDLLRTAIAEVQPEKPVPPE